MSMLAPGHAQENLRGGAVYPVTRGSELGGDLELLHTLDKCSSAMRVNILGVGIHAVNPDEAVDRIERFVAKGGAHYVCVSNVFSIMMSQRDAEFRRITNEADLAVPDGMPLAWLARWHGHEQRDRVYGPDLMLGCCQRSLKTGTSHFFYGGARGVPELLAQNLTARFPGLKVAGCYSPPFRPLTPAEDEDVVRMINDSGADMLWVSLGAPKQERWMAQHVGRIKAPVMIGVGAAFPFLTGTVKQAPRWMQKSGLEWLFRLCIEPRRLWRRYLLNNPLFILLTLCQLTGLKKCDLS